MSCGCAKATRGHARADAPNQMASKHSVLVVVCQIAWPGAAIDSEVPVSFSCGMGSWRRAGDGDWDLDRRGSGRHRPARKLPLLRVRPDSRGHLQPSPRAFGPLDHSEEWWASVMRDYRSREVDPRRQRDRLADCRGRSVTFACEPCGIRRTVAVDDVLPRFGADYLVQYLKHDLVQCPQRRGHRRCGVAYVERLSPGSTSEPAASREPIRCADDE